MASRRAAPKAKQTKYIVLIGGVSPAVIEAASPDEAAEEFLVKHKYLPEMKDDARKALMADSRKHKPYLFERLTVRVATDADLRRYAALVDVTKAPKKSLKPREPKRSTRDRLFGGAA